MTNTDSALAITLRVRDHTRTVPPESIAAVLRLSPSLVRTALTGLLFASLDQRDELDSLVPGEPTESPGFFHRSYDLLLLWLLVMYRSVSM